MTMSFLLLLAAGAAGLIILLAVLVLLGWLLVRAVRNGQGVTPLKADQTEAAISVVAALFVLLTAMLSPLLSVGLAVVFLLGLAGYKLLLPHKVS